MSFPDEGEPGIGSEDDVEVRRRLGRGFTRLRAGNSGTSKMGEEERYISFTRYPGTFWIYPSSSTWMGAESPGEKGSTGLAKTICMLFSVSESKVR